MSDAALLESLGYAEAAAPSTGATGVTVSDGRPRAIRVVGAFGPEARTIDASGTIVSVLRAEPPLPEGLWRSATPLGDDLLVVVEGRALARLNPNNTAQWVQRGAFHHEVLPQSDGTALALDRTAAAGAVHDRVLTLDLETGATLAILDLLPLARAAGLPIATVGDPLHANALEWTTSGLLISLRQPSALWWIDLGTAKSTRWTTGAWAAQHDPRSLPNGDIVLFDNRGAPSGSRVLRVDADGRERVWATGFDSPWCGAVDPLEDGGVLVTDGVAGRIVDVGPDGTVRWAFASPWTTGNGASRALLTEARAVLLR